MKTQNSLTLDRLKIFVIIVILIGISFRLINIEKKAFTGDEVFTSLRISGYSVQDFKQEIPENRTFNIREILKYQKVNSEKKIINTIQGLATEEPQLPPLYFLVTRFWVDLFGDSIAITRSTSVIFSILTIPAIYWLCLELFELILVRWFGMAIVAVSPFHILHAQVARPYALWILITVLSSAALLKALRKKQITSWLMYLCLIVLGLYSHLLMIYVLISHGIYVAIVERLRLTRSFYLFSLSSLVGFLLFLPWITVIIYNLEAMRKTSSWALTYTPFIVLLNEWTRNLCYSVADFWYIFTYVPKSEFNYGFGKLLIPVISIFIIYSIYFSLRHTLPRTRLFLLLLIFIPAFPLVLPDLIYSGYRSVYAKYFVPSYVAINLLIAYFMAYKINLIYMKSKSLKCFWQATFLLIIGLGILSGLVSFQSELWWTTGANQDDILKFSRIINDDDRPLLLESKENFGTLAALSHQLKSNVSVQLLPSRKRIKQEDMDLNGFDSAFLIVSPKTPEYSLPNLEKHIYKGRKINMLEIRKNP